MTVTRYWDPAAVAVLPWSDAEAADALREALTRAVRSQLMSEVPLGAFLSGGIDSSSIVALMSTVSDQPVKTFTMGFEDGSYNEMPYAHEVATLFGTEHTERLVTPDLGDLFDRLIPHLDSPFADVSLFPTYLVSQVARERVTVALSGDGGDELFGGYDAYEAQALASRFASVGAPLVPALAAVGAALPPTGQKKGLVNKFKRFIGGVATAPADLEHYRWMVHLGSRAKRRLYAPALAAALDGSDVYAPVREVLARGSRDDVLNRQLFTDLMLYLADDILVKVDRMSMATSLETRAPFLDVDVMELAFSMPGTLKVRDGVRKYVLKQAMRGRRARAHPAPQEGRLQHPDQELAASRARAADARPAVAGARGAPRPVRAGRSGAAHRRPRRRTREPRPHAVPADGVRAVGRRPPRLSSPGGIVRFAASPPGTRRGVERVERGDFGGVLRAASQPSVARHHRRGGVDRRRAWMAGRAGLGPAQQRIGQGDRPLRDARRAEPRRRSPRTAGASGAAEAGSARRQRRHLARHSVP